MLNSILFIVLGVIIGVIVVVAWAGLWSRKLLAKNQFASARFDTKSKEWRICGKYAKIAQELVDIREGRKPGAIKYID